MRANLTSKVWNLELLWSQELLLMLSWSPLVNRYLLYIHTIGQPLEYIQVKLTGSCVLKVPLVECWYILIDTWLTSWSILGQHLINACSTASSQSNKCWPTDMYWSTISRLLSDCQPRCLSGINWESTEEEVKGPKILAFSVLNRIR